MKYKYNLNEFGINSKTIKYDDKVLSTKTLQSLLSYITKVYIDKIGSEWFSISSKSLHSISHDYIDYINYMVKIKILIVNDSYSTGTETTKAYTKSFLFTDYFKKKAELVDCSKDDNEYRYNRYKVIVDRKLEKKIEQDFKSLKVKSFDVEKEHYINNDGIEIYAFKTYLKQKRLLYSIFYGVPFWQWGGEMKQYFNKEDKLDKSFQSSRIYSSFCFLKNENRHNVCFHKELCNVDIRSSFALFLAIYCTNNGIDKNSFEMKDFCSGLRDGTFYNKLQFKLNKVKDTIGLEEERPYYNKKMVKTAFQIWLNDDNLLKSGDVKMKGDTIGDMNAIMSAYYPEIYNLVVNKTKEYKEDMFFILEYMEANFIFNTILPKLYSIKGIKIVTCHDAIYFEKIYEQLVNEIWNDELNKLYNQLTIIEEQENDENENFNMFGIEKSQSIWNMKQEKYKLLDELLPTEKEDAFSF